MMAVDAGGITTILAGFASVGFHAPWQRFDVDAEAWTAIAKSLGNGAADLLGLWGDAGAVHMALRALPADPFVVSVATSTLPGPAGPLPVPPPLAGEGRVGVASEITQGSAVCMRTAMWTASASPHSPSRSPAPLPSVLAMAVHPSASTSKRCHGA